MTGKHVRIEFHGPNYLVNIVRIITETGLRIYKELMPMKKENGDLANAVVWMPDSGIAEVPFATDHFFSERPKLHGTSQMNLRASIFPYDDVNIDRAKVSMKIGGEYRLRNLRQYHWRKLAADLRLDPDATIDRVTTLAAQLADQVSGVKHQMAAEGLDHPVIGNLAEALAERVEAILKMFKRL